ncbi:MAG TPA: T9SS type A sorting domain-containing protein [Chitinophagales bacterium]|nr:T9SS type A sorting domain-containing protein [Chitinophagales bacterium]HRP39452.1 T9SS type A sorting domain-containing protein [Chitinophagales bacterium]
MRKLVLGSLLGGLVATTANAQTVPNAGFENWKNDTSILNVNQSGIILTDTFSFEDPIDWTSVNYITGADTFEPGPGGVIMVTKSNTANTGSFAAQIETKNITIPVIGMQTGIPGFVISGEFKISVADLMGGGGFSPTSLPGSGIPVTGRLDSFSVYADYTPVTGDSALLLAVLRKGTDVVATAAQFINGATNGYKKFTVPFVYSSCDVPDSLTYALASSNLFALQSLFSSLGGGATIPAGSKLLVDDVAYTLAPGNYVINPIARQDDTVTNKNTPITVNVLANDEDCDGAATVSLGTISTTTAHGTAAKSGNNITYTPMNNYVGFDTVYYQLTSTTGLTSNSFLRVRVNDPAGIADFNLINVKAFPNPASSALNIVADIQNGSLNVTDLSGRKVLASSFSGKTSVDVSTLSVGTYFVTLQNAQGAIVGKTKFFVAK